jgi:hypothetical protein
MCEVVCGRPQYRKRMIMNIQLKIIKYAKPQQQQPLERKRPYMKMTDYNDYDTKS